jgi:hypothetical protein
VTKWRGEFRVRGAGCECNVAWKLPRRRGDAEKPNGPAEEGLGILNGLRLRVKRAGLLINFHAPVLKDGIVRRIL